jgi:diguanylate cyclase (GGDEF)-like protein
VATVSISKIAKETISQLTKQNTPLTPDTYLETFCSIANKYHASIKDCKKLDTYIQKLDSKTLEELKRYKLQTVDELFSFLSSKIKRLNVATQSDVIDSIVFLIHTLFDTITTFKNKEAKQLASTSKDRFETIYTPENINLIAKTWQEFPTKNNYTFLDELEKYFQVDKSSFKQTVQNIISGMEQMGGSNEDIFISIIETLSYTLKPSISTKLSTEISNVTKKLKINNDLLKTENLHKNIKALVNKRIHLDNVEVSEKIAQLDSIILQFGESIIKVIDKSNISNEQIGQIKTTLTSLSLNKGDLQTVKDQLVTITESLDFETKSMTKKLEQDQVQIAQLQKKIKKLEEQVKKSRQESEIDFLTGVYTRRAFDREIKRVEDGFKRYGEDFSICFIDLDYFKQINDTYGHDAGDMVLAKVGEILKESSRDFDIVARYGGEEFIAILPHIGLIDGVKYAKKLQKVIKTKKFMYKDQQMNITASFGVSQRKQHMKLEDTIKKADQMVYAAKEAGRDVVFPKM